MELEREELEFEHVVEREIGSTLPPEESSTEEVKNDEEEDWECKACSEDDGVANDFLGCDTCNRWFHIHCVNKKADDFFQYQYCQ